ncbi:hypothetical protein [Streptomyces mangrovisoli]|uniref:Uncharacterized protein n=1 Tax=Streptomyces mangrovisoli TaxID=1428628 RepID=A0A1J4NPB5_9ACTN|nr:hypothetical protein [Streptomyces mangrovisoli]OIJ63978.1 hypothetical protein WN71_031810 [Streptomyces mangrovisoli]
MSAAVVVAVMSLTGCDGSPRPVGDPDPGHRRLKAIQPVLSVVPPGAHVTLKQSVAPRWDSCDGMKSTYGWDPATVAVDFTGGGSARQVAAQVEAAMRRLGWTLDEGSLAQGEWTWHKKLTDGARASAHLLGGPHTQPPDWDLQATAPPVTHPSKGC